MNMGCYQCGTKICRKTVNGYVSPMSNRKQLAILCKHDGDTKESIVHVPVCANCTQAVNLTNIFNTCKDDKSFATFLRLSPDARFVSCEIEAQ